MIRTFESRIIIINFKRNLKHNFMSVKFYSRNTLFIDNISQFNDVFEAHWKGDEYEVFVNPQNADDLKVICDIFYKYTSSWDELVEVTDDFLEYGNLHSHYGEIYDDEKGDKIVDDAAEYTRLLYK